MNSGLARPRGVRLQHKVEPPIPFLQRFITPIAHAVNTGFRSVRRAAAILGLSPVSVCELCAMYGSPLFGDVRTQPGRARMGRSPREDASSGETRRQPRSLGRQAPPQTPYLVTSSTSPAILTPTPNRTVPDIRPSMRGGEGARRVHLRCRLYTPTAAQRLGQNTWQEAPACGAENTRPAVLEHLDPPSEHEPRRIRYLPLPRPVDAALDDLNPAEYRLCRGPRRGLPTAGTGRHGEWFDCSIRCAGSMIGPDSLMATRMRPRPRFESPHVGLRRTCGRTWLNYSRCLRQRRCMRGTTRRCGGRWLTILS